MQKVIDMAHSWAKSCCLRLSLHTLLTKTRDPQGRGASLGYSKDNVKCMKTVWTVNKDYQVFISPSFAFIAFTLHWWTQVSLEPNWISLRIFWGTRLTVGKRETGFYPRERDASETGSRSNKRNKSQQENKHLWETHLSSFYFMENILWLWKYKNNSTEIS